MTASGDLLHLLEGFVEGERGHVAEDGVEDVALDLALRIAQLVVGVEDLGLDDLVLHRDGDGDEDVVLGLGFDVDRGLAHLQIDEAHGFALRHQKLQAGPRDAVELAEALHDAGGVGAHGVHGFEHRDEHKDGYDAGDDEGKDDKRRGIHGWPFLLRHGSGKWKRDLSAF